MPSLESGGEIERVSESSAEDSLDFGSESDTIRELEVSRGRLARLKQSSIPKTPLINNRPLFVRFVVRCRQPL